MSLSYFMFNELELKAVVRFVNIDGIVDHHCLKLLFYRSENEN